MDILDILDKLLDYLNVPENKQDHGEAFVRLEALAVYHAAIVAGRDEDAEKAKEFMVKYLGMQKDHFTLFMDAVL